MARLRASKTSVLTRGTRRNILEDGILNRLRVFENRVLRKIFRPKRDGVTGGRRKLHNEELHHLCSSPSIVRIVKSRRMRWAGHVTRMGEKRNVYRLVVGEPEGKRPLGRPRWRQVDNIKMDLARMGCGGVDWIGMVQNRDKQRALVNAVMNIRGSIECWETIEWLHNWQALE
jgi:hypothetical protein